MGTREDGDVTALQTQPVSPASLDPAGHALLQNRPTGQVLGFAPRAWPCRHEPSYLTSTNVSLWASPEIPVRDHFPLNSTRLPHWGSSPF